MKELDFTITTISEEMGNYYKSNNLYYESEYNPFSEPVNVYSNIHNGYGLFSSFSTDTDLISFR